jgi:hypothetical protein
MTSIGQAEEGEILGELGNSEDTQLKGCRGMR